MTTYFTKTRWAWLGIGAVLVACSVDTKPTNPDGLVPAEVNALSTYEAALGTTIEVTGRDFPAPGLGYLQLVFTGDFVADNGSTFAVPATAVNLQVLSATSAAWDRFGPFYNPFDREGNNTGYFEGEMSARVITTPDGTAEGGEEINQATEPVPISFRVKPSIRVRQFLPLTLPDDACGGVAVQRAITQLPYALRVEALGFDPIKFDYRVIAPALEGLEGYQPLHFEEPVQGRFGTFGMDPANLLKLWGVPGNQLSYTAIITVTAIDAQGNSLQNTFGIGVHRPLEPIYNGNLRVAEYLAPVTAIGCVYGGDAGTGAALVLTKAHADTRTIAESIAWSDSWIASHTIASSEQIGTVQTVTDGFSIATTNGNEFQYQLQAAGEVGGNVGGDIDFRGPYNNGIGIDGGVGAKAVFTGFINDKDITSQTETGSNIDSLSQSEVTTRAEADSLARARQEAGAVAESISSTDIVGEGIAYTVVPQVWGTILQQPIRLLREATIVEFNQCGAAHIRGEYTLDDWTWQVTLGLGPTCFDAQTGQIMSNNLHKPECVVERDKCKYH